jgi:hypothetical protein
MNSPVNPQEPIDYSSNHTPSSYVCKECRKHSIKLWRGYNAFTYSHILLCADCSAREEGADISTMDSDGKSRSAEGILTDKIGGRVPAIPTAENDAFWGYSSVPDAGVQWWRRLPVR